LGSGNFGFVGSVTAFLVTLVRVDPRAGIDPWIVLVEHHSFNVPFFSLRGD